MESIEREVPRSYTAFAGDRLIESGQLETVLLRTKDCLDQGRQERVLIFEDQTGVQLDFDLHGTPEAVLARLAAHPHFAGKPAAASPPTGPGRPRLGVVCREVSLLPRHWAWLESQPGGISVALRKLVDEARKLAPGKERARMAREAAGKFMWVMAGNLPDFEEASRALYAKDDAKLELLSQSWPKDIRAHVLRLAREASRLEGAGS